MAGLIKHKIHGSTLIETLIAIVIILTCFSIAMMFFIKLNQSSFTEQHLKAEQLVKEQLYTSLENNNYIDDQFSVEELTVSQTISTYQNYPNILILKVEAINRNNKTLAVRKQLIINYK
jgi:Tfp pilus assembly protein PilV